MQDLKNCKNVCKLTSGKKFKGKWWNNFYSWKPEDQYLYILWIANDLVELSTKVDLGFQQNMNTLKPLDTVKYLPSGLNDVFMETSDKREMVNPPTDSILYAKSLVDNEPFRQNIPKSYDVDENQRLYRAIGTVGYMFSKDEKCRLLLYKLGGISKPDEPGLVYEVVFGIVKKDKMIILSLAMMCWKRWKSKKFPFRDLFLPSQFPSSYWSSGQNNGDGDLGSYGSDENGKKFEEYAEEKYLSGNTVKIEVLRIFSDKSTYWVVLYTILFSLMRSDKGVFPISVRSGSNLFEDLVFKTKNLNDILRKFVDFKEGRTILDEEEDKVEVGLLEISNYMENIEKVKLFILLSEIGLSEHRMVEIAEKDEEIPVNGEDGKIHFWKLMILLFSYEEMEVFNRISKKIKEWQAS